MDCGDLETEDRGGDLATGGGDVLSTGESSNVTTAGIIPGRDTNGDLTDWALEAAGGVVPGGNIDGDLLEEELAPGGGAPMATCKQLEDDKEEELEEEELEEEELEEEDEELREEAILQNIYNKYKLII